MDSGIYPKAWCHGFTVPIFKHGKAEPANHRSITIKNSLNELFSLCIQKQTKDILEKENILSLPLAGFGKNHRTTDYIFILFSQINKSVKKGKYLYGVIHIWRPWKLSNFQPPAPSPPSSIYVQNSSTPSTLDVHFGNQLVLFAQHENVNKLWNSNRTVHVK